MIDIETLRIRREAIEEAAKVLAEIKPPGGRQWSSEQAAVYAALTEAEKAIRSLPDTKAQTSP